MGPDPLLDWLADPAVRAAVLQSSAALQSLRHPLRSLWPACQQLTGPLAGSMTFCCNHHRSPRRRGLRPR